MGNTPIVYTVLSGNIALFQLLRQALATTQQLQLLEECNVVSMEFIIDLWSQTCG